MDKHLVLTDAKKKQPHANVNCQCLHTAAAVFEVGRLEQSPRAKIFPNWVCLNVPLSTLTKLLAFGSVRPGVLINTSGEVMGGVRWSRSY